MDAASDRFVLRLAEAFRWALRSRRARTRSSAITKAPSTDATMTRIMRFAAKVFPVPR